MRLTASPVRPRFRTLVARRACVLLLVLPGAVVTAPAAVRGQGAMASAQRTPPPAAIEQARAEKLVRGVHEQDYRKAKASEADRAKLAATLLAKGREARDDPATRFVLLSEARTLAKDAGEVRLALAALDELASSYAVDAVALEAEVLLSIKPGGGTAGTGSVAGLWADACLALAGAAVEAGNTTLAAQLAARGEALARQTKQPELVARVTRRAEDVRQLQAEAAAAADAERRVAANPADAKARGTLGRFLCMQKGNWDGGLPHLERCGEQPLVELAQAELAAPAEATSRAALAGLWWDLAEQRGGCYADRMRARAAHWYRAALPDLSEIPRQLAAKRVEAVEAAGARARRFGAPVYLADVPPREAGVGYGRLHKASVVVGGVTWPNSLFAHGPSRVVYALDGRYRVFKTGAGIPDSTRPGAASPVMFKVVGDGRTLWTSKPVQAGGSREQCELSVAGVTALELIVEVSRSKSAAHTLWLDVQALP